jgi:hypothetical protein
MIYFMPISGITGNRALFDPEAACTKEERLMYDRHKGKYIRINDTYLDFMKERLNTRGNKDIFVFVSAYNKDPEIDKAQTPQLLKILEENDLTKHIHYERRELTNRPYAKGNIDLFILTRKTKTSHQRITLEHINA